eukprot:scaffold170405_cov34-Tisochrysis_lutea.AAC.3
MAGWLEKKGNGKGKGKKRPEERGPRLPVDRKVRCKRRLHLFACHRNTHTQQQVCPNPPLALGPT